MQRQEPPATAFSVASSNQEGKEPSSMASRDGAGPTRRSATTDEIAVLKEGSPTAEEFEFCVLSSGGLALAGEDDAAGMCAADEVFSGGKLLPLRLSTGDASALLLPRSDSQSTSGSGCSSRSTSRSASSSTSSSSCVSRSASWKCVSTSDPANLALGSSLCLSNKSASSSEAVKPEPAPRRSLTSSVFYAHPSPSPRPPPRRVAASSAPRRSTGSAPPAAAWGVIRLGVVGAPEVYQRRAPADSTRKVVAVATRGGRQSARFEQAGAGATRKVPLPVDKKLGLFGAGLVCSCSPDAVAPVGTVEAAEAEARRRRNKAQDKKRAAKKQTTGQSSYPRSRILHWLEELSMVKQPKNIV